MKYVSAMEVTVYLSCWFYLMFQPHISNISVRVSWEYEVGHPCNEQQYGIVQQLLDFREIYGGVRRGEGRG